MPGANDNQDLGGGGGGGVVGCALGEEGKMQLPSGTHRGKMN